LGRDDERQRATCDEAGQAGELGKEVHDSDVVGGEPAETDDFVATAEACVGGAGGGDGVGGGASGGLGLDVVGRTLDDRLAPCAGGGLAGGGVVDVAVGADGEGVGAHGE